MKCLGLVGGDREPGDRDTLKPPDVDSIVAVGDMGGVERVLEPRASPCLSTPFGDGDDDPMDTPPGEP